MNNTMINLWRKVKFFGGKYAPEIMIGSAIVAGAGAIVLSCRGTLKVDRILDEHKRKMDEINNAAETLPDDYTEEDVQADKRKLFIGTGIEIAKAYFPAACCAGASVAMMIGARNVLANRNAVAIAALESTAAAFSSYRDRVRERLGAEAEKDILIGKDFETEQVEVKNGKKTEIVENVKETYNPDKNVQCSPYSRFFSEDTTKRFQPNSPEYNKSFLENCQMQANIDLHMNGFLFLNDVYSMLGFEQTPEGQLVGWLDSSEDEPMKDISFGIDRYDLNKRAFNCDEEVWLLDFNVDGVIFDKI